jgi:hypothetical protein
MTPAVSAHRPASMVGVSRERVLRPSGSDDHGDFVEAGPRVVSAGRRRLIAGLALVAVLVAATAWYVDGRRRAHEFSALLHCVTAAESDWTAADARTTSMANYVRPGVGVNPSVTVAQGLYGMVADEAAIGVPDVRQALRLCRSVRVLAFHSNLRAARAAYVTALQAEVDRLAATAADGSHAFDGSEGLTRLRARARVDLSAAAPDEQARRSVLHAMGPR